MQQNGVMLKTKVASLEGGKYRIREGKDKKVSEKTR